MSVDAKKEMVGNFKNARTAWTRTPVLVNDHDFRSDAGRMATRYEIYDGRANLGAVFVGTSYDTPGFASENLARWREAEGRERYPGGATARLVLADGGGRNGPRTRAFRYARQTRLGGAHRIQVTPLLWTDAEPCGSTLPGEDAAKSRLDTPTSARATSASFSISASIAGRFFRKRSLSRSSDLRHTSVRPSRLRRRTSASCAGRTWRS